MSLPWQQIRGAHIDPSSIRFTNLLNKQNMFENELFKPPSKQITILSSDTHDRMAYNDRYFFNKLKYNTTKYYMPFEPDGKHLKVWCRFDHLARNIKDYAMSISSESYPAIETLQIYPQGDPILCKGPDDGVKGGTICSRINSKNTTDYFNVSNPAEYGIGVQESTAGFSMYLAFMLEGDPVQDNGEDPTLWFHVDDVNGDQGTMVKVGEDRSLKFFVKRSGTVRNFISEPNKITSGMFHYACLRYNFTGDVMSMKIDNVPAVDSASETPTFPDSHEDGLFWGIGSFKDAGRFTGRLADFRLYQDLIFLDDHELNIWNNKRSICAVNALLFDGVNDYIDCTNDATLWSQSLTKFSFSFWCFPTAGWDTNFREIVVHGSGAQSFTCYIDDAVSNRINFEIRDSGNNPFNARSTALVLNRWNFVLCEYDNSLGSANLKIYVNGVLGGTTANLTEAINKSATLSLANSTTDFKGYMRDFRWWTTIALTPAQVIAVRDNLPSAPVPDYWLRLGEGSGNPIDWITRTKVGTLNGATWTIGSNPHPIEYGTLDVIGYAKFNDQEFTAGFDSVGYDSTGFDTS